MKFDPEFWKSREGDIVDALFPLGRCLGQTARGAIFETEFEGQPAAIRIVPGTPDSTHIQREQWERAARLSHPALIRLFTSGETALGGTPCTYLVMERAEENLADVIAERRLTSAEAEEMLAPLLDALRYLHAQGFAHGGLKPSNIMAIGDQLKIASDGLLPSGDPAVDSRALVVLLNDALGPQASRTEPFAGIIRNFEASLPRPARPSAPASKSRRLWWGGAAAVAAVLSVIALLPSQTHRPSPSSDAPAPQPRPAPASTLVDDTKPLPTAGPVTARKRKSARTTRTGVTQVLPEIPRDALNTINGRVRINVRLRVDSAGNVSHAALEPPAASKYFSARVLAAAKAWKFPPADSPRDVKLRFELTREQTDVSMNGER